MALDLVQSVGESGVTLCFTERLGGISPRPYQSLNLGLRQGDSPANVAENRKRVFEALDRPELAPNVLVPKQVHGDTVVVADKQSRASLFDRELECDAIVCTVPNQAVMLLFADCVPIVLVCDRGFAVIHSGWRGTLAGISAKAAGVLSQVTGCNTQDILAYIGPHIHAEAYEVSQDMTEMFTEVFGAGVFETPRHLSMAACIHTSLAQAGIQKGHVYTSPYCTVKNVDRFFSYRAEQQHTGRQAALAFMDKEVYR
ncbi:MAG: peptidoglycan editing factor PgeF [Coriobacteriales bacterium]|nr:peptidoglycan editing factor PgeF [Coriobacteriales bacterium]